MQQGRGGRAFEKILPSLNQEQLGSEHGSVESIQNQAANSRSLEQSEENGVVPSHTPQEQQVPAEYSLV